MSAETPAAEAETPEHTEPPEIITVETPQTRFLRIFGHVVLVVGGLYVLDRFGSIFVPGHSWRYWLGFAVLVGLFVAWGDLCRSPLGQRILGSAAAARFVMVGVSVFLAFALVEGFMRTEFSRQHVFGVWPAYSLHLAPDETFYQEYNAAGFRDEVTHTRASVSGRARVLVLGDSFTAGQGVGIEEYYPAHLRDLAGEDVAVIVAARPGANTRDQLTYLEEYGCQFRPNVVMVGAVTNDPDNGDRSWENDWRIFTATEASNPYLPHSFFYLDYNINRLAENLGWRYGYWQWETDLFDENQPWLRQWAEDVEALAQAARDCGAAHLMAFTLPAPVNYGNDDLRAEYERRHRLMAETFTRAGFTAENLLPAYIEEFGEQPYRSLWALPNDPHPNPAVHAWYAEQMWAELQTLAE